MPLWAHCFGKPLFILPGGLTSCQALSLAPPLQSWGLPWVLWEGDCF